MSEHSTDPLQPPSVPDSDDDSPRHAKRVQGALDVAELVSQQFWRFEQPGLSVLLSLLLECWTLSISTLVDAIGTDSTGLVQAIDRACGLKRSGISDRLKLANEAWLGIGAPQPAGINPILLSLPENEYEVNILVSIIDSYYSFRVNEQKCIDEGKLPRLLGVQEIIDRIEEMAERAVPSGSFDVYNQLESAPDLYDPGRLGVLVRDARTGLGYSLQRMAKRLQVSKTTLYAIESGNLPRGHSREMLSRLIRELKLDPVDVLQSAGYPIMLFSKPTPVFEEGVLDDWERAELLRYLSVLRRERPPNAREDEVMLSQLRSELADTERALERSTSRVRSLETEIDSLRRGESGAELQSRDRRDKSR